MRWKEEAAKVEKDIRSGNLKVAEPGLVKLLEQERFMRIEAHMMAVALYENMGEKEKAQKHRDFLKGIADTVFVNGRGMSFEKPLEVLFIDEEYLVLRAMGIDHKSQSLREKDGHRFDVFTFEAKEGQPEREIYFNIDMPFECAGQELRRCHRPDQEARHQEVAEGHCGGSGLTSAEGWKPGRFSLESRGGSDSGCFSPGGDGSIAKGSPGSRMGGRTTAAGGIGLPDESSRRSLLTKGSLLREDSTWDRSPTIRIVISSGVMYFLATRSTSALVTASIRAG